MENKLAFGDLHIGMEVVGENGKKGVILECCDPHNILIQFENGGWGYACLKSDCSEGPDVLFATPPQKAQ